MTLRDHLEALYREHGQLTPELVVEAARPADHPLHAYVFDRAVPDAAEAWYRHRAHELIQSVRISYTPAAPNAEARTVRAFHAVRQADAGAAYVYKAVEDIAHDPLAAQMVLREAEREWKQLRARYGHLREFLELVRGEVEAA